MFKEKRGITLIALVVTIIVLLILAAISISAITGENGIIAKAKKAQEETENAKLKEALELKLAEAQIDMTIGEDPLEVLESLIDFMQGVYRVDIIPIFDTETKDLELIEVKINGIFKNESELVKGTLIAVIDQDLELASMEFENVKKVSSADDLSQVIVKIVKNDSEVEIIESNSSIVTASYKEKLYDIFYVKSSSKISIVIELRENFVIADKKWKNVFTSDDYTIAQDIDNKYWIWNMTDRYTIDEIAPICLNNIYSEFDKLNFTDAIYQYDRWGYKKIIGFIDNAGKMYLFNNGFINDGSTFVCLNDLYPNHLSGIKAKNVLPVEFEGLDIFMRNSRTSFIGKNK